MSPDARDKLKHVALLGLFAGAGTLVVWRWVAEAPKVAEVEEVEVKASEMNVVQAALEIILFEESRGGVTRGEVGPAGERGMWQVTPIWERDVERIFGEQVDPDDLAGTGEQVRRWLEWYGPKAGCVTVEDYRELYRRGPTGYRTWKGTRHANR